jgi:hypothetical protein
VAKWPNVLSPRLLPSVPDREGEHDIGIRSPGNAVW